MRPSLAGNFEMIIVSGALQVANTSCERVNPSATCNVFQSSSLRCKLLGKCLV